MRQFSLTERRILDKVRRKPGLSRTAVAGQLGLSPALLTKTVTRFVEIGILSEERQKRTARRGQPALMLSVCPRAVVGLGLSLSTDGVYAAALDLNGEILGIERRQLDAEDLDAAIETAEAALAPLMKDADHIAGVSIWAPGLPDQKGGIAEVTPSQRALDYQGLRAGLAGRLDFPVTLESRAWAIYEAMHNSRSDPVFYKLFLDFGIGGSLIDGLQVFRGAFGQASNIGAMMPDSGPRPSLPDLADTLGIEVSALDLREIEQRMDEGDPVLSEWVASRGARLSEPLSAVVQLLNPAAIVVGGLFPHNVLKALISHINLDFFDQPDRVGLVKPEIRVASIVGPDSMAVTAASVPIYRNFVPFEWWVNMGSRQGD